MSDVGESFRKYLASIPEYQIQIGVFSMKTKRKTTYSVGITNAELMFIHENGSPLHHLPARPVLKMTIKYGNTLIKNVMQKALKAYSTNGITGLENELNKLCIRTTVDSHPTHQVLQLAKKAITRYLIQDSLHEA